MSKLTSRPSFAKIVWTVQMLSSPNAVYSSFRCEAFVILQCLAIRSIIGNRSRGCDGFLLHDEESQHQCGFVRLLRIRCPVCALILHQDHCVEEELTATMAGLTRRFHAVGNDCEMRGRARAVERKYEQVDWALPRRYHGINQIQIILRACGGRDKSSTGQWLRDISFSIALLALAPTARVVWYQFKSVLPPKYT